MHLFILATGYFIFVHLTLLLPGYALVSRLGYFKEKPELEIGLGYTLTIVFAALIATLTYALKIHPFIGRGIGWLAIMLAIVECARCQYYRRLWSHRFSLFCLFAMSAMALLFISLPFGNRYSFVPDPKPVAGANYHVLNVKVLNLSHTQANDNYIPYRQAQFFVNRSDPARDSFISEWGVSFFERTPLMGAVTAHYFNLVHDKVPVAFLWAQGSQDPDHTYLQFQILASVLNTLFIIPTIIILKKLFNKKVAHITALFIAVDPFFLQNTYFTWPKSLVAFFILLSWCLLLDSKRKRNVIAAGFLGGIAYMTHDLAIFYIAASVVFLLINKRLRDAIWMGAIPLGFALMWLIISTKVYSQTSSFIYYPLSTQNLPPADGKGVVHNFLHTPVSRILLNRLDNLAYLLTPYQLFTSEGGQSLQTRISALNIFSIVGALGFGGMAALVGALWKRFATKEILVLALVPVVCCLIFIGWPKGLGAVHFAQAVVVLLQGLGVAFLISLRQKIWLVGAYLLTVLQLIFFVLVCYDFQWRSWLTHLNSIVTLCIMLMLLCTYSFFIISLSSKHPVSMRQE